MDGDGRGIEEEEGVYLWFTRGTIEGPSSSFYWSYGGREMMLEGWCGILVKEELCDGVIEIQKRSDRMMIMCLIFGEEMLQVICVYKPQSGKPDIQKNEFYDEMFMNGI